MSHGPAEGRRVTPLHLCQPPLTLQADFWASHSKGIQAQRGRGCQCPSAMSPPNRPRYGHWGPLTRTVSLDPSQGLAVLWAPPGTHQHGSELLLQCQYQNPWEKEPATEEPQRQTGDTESTSGDSNFRTRCWPLGLCFCLLLKAEPVLFNPYTLYPPNKGPTNPKGPGHLRSLP